MFKPTPNNTKHKSRSTATLMAIAKPLALMAVLLSVSPAAFAVRDCDDDETKTADVFCDDMGKGHSTGCWVHDDGTMEIECFGDTGVIYSLDSHGELPEDDERGDPVDPSSTPDDADELVDDEVGFSDDDGDTDPDERLEIGACCVDLACIDDLTEDECEYEELGAWFASMDCADTVTECAAVDPDPTGDDEDELVDEEPGFSDDDGDITGADDGDTGRDDDDDGDTGDADTGDADRDDSVTLTDGCVVNAGRARTLDNGIEINAGAARTLSVGQVVNAGAARGGPATGLGSGLSGSGAIEPAAEAGASAARGGSKTGVPAVSCSSTGGSRGGFHLMLPLALMGMAAGFRRREVQ